MVNKLFFTFIFVQLTHVGFEKLSKVLLLVPLGLTFAVLNKERIVDRTPYKKSSSPSLSIYIYQYVWP